MRSAPRTGLVLVVALLLATRVWAGHAQTAMPPSTGPTPLEVPSSLACEAVRHDLSRVPATRIPVDQFGDFGAGAPDTRPSDPALSGLLELEPPPEGPDLDRSPVTPPR